MSARLSRIFFRRLIRARFTAIIILLCMYTPSIGSAYAHVLDESPRVLIPSTKWLTINIGEIVSSDTEMKFENGETLKLHLLRSSQPGNWTTGVDEPPTTAQIFRVSDKVIRLMDGSPLCGENPITHIAAWHDADQGGAHAEYRQGGQTVVVSLAFFTGPSPPLDFFSEGRCFQVTMYLGPYADVPGGVSRAPSIVQRPTPRTEAPNMQNSPNSLKETLGSRECELIGGIAREIAIWRDNGRSLSASKAAIEEVSSSSGADKYTPALLSTVEYVYRHASLSPSLIKAHFDLACGRR
ncbi:hypothetical protein SAMN05443999_1216 [Roseovarius azorensis]|uniref:Uncharacterized protein n=1 Tax=Roseovarius azorensis TaxID=1287727 RepID=A0A1H7XKP2_9RHOB|nr:hypothetical protein [Roseovarius azorensis]SEM33579.1 hypothetical protein SAMN05443999_1216 [Roseovarius azorensis]